MRNVKLDLSRGLLMIYIIVIIHGVFWLRLIPRPYSTVLLFSMPLIFLVSGYTFGFTSKKKQINLPFYWNYSKARFSRIIIPYLAYALPCILVVIFIGKNTNNSQVILSWLNPLRYGRGHTISSLNWHLWFIPSFLIVTLLLPICKIRFFDKISTIGSLIFLSLFFLFLSYYESRFTTPLFYFIWAFLGYKLSVGLTFSSKQLLLFIATGVLILLFAKFSFNASLDMQSNKFPPNFLFLVFCAIWVSIVLLISPKVPSDLINSVEKNKIVKVFITSGYTLYLWQGLGYMLAKYLQHKFEINVILTWFIGVSITFILGLLVSPIEKLRWKQSIQNASIERENGNIRSELLNAYAFKTLEEVQEKIEK